MDNFFAKKACDRCGTGLDQGRIMSIFNTDCICIRCSKKENHDKDYDKALEADQDEIKKGNYNFKGIRGEK